VGNGVNPQGNPEGWVARDLDLATLLPEPGAPVLLCCGVVALAALARPRPRR
jgi:hypothetical protein